VTNVPPEPDTQRAGWPGLVDEAKRLVDRARPVGVEMRLLGSIGIRLHCQDAADELDARSRAPKDIDFVVGKLHRRDLRHLFEAEGYEVDRGVLVTMEGRRYIFRDVERDIEIDVFVEELDFNHTIDVSKRLDIHRYVLSVEDLVLSKLQIVELTDNDVCDLQAILATHVVGEGPTDPEVVDLDYVTGLLADDWGFWRTATANLETVRDRARLNHVAERAGVLLAAVRSRPKTLKWRLRSRVGERRQWWQDVDLPRSAY